MTGTACWRDGQSLNASFHGFDGLRFQWKFMFGKGRGNDLILVLTMAGGK
jgi:hypothetical protein